MAKRGGVPPKPIADRIRESVVVDEAGCWVWTKFQQYGYGRIFVGSWIDDSRRNKASHRASYEEFVGEIPDGYHIDHLCRNTLCCNPEHLEAVTPKLNAVRRAAYQGGYEVCARGHRQTARTWRFVDGKLACLPCMGRIA